MVPERRDGWPRLPRSLRRLGQFRLAISIRPGGFLELAELIDLHLAIGEHGFNLQRLQSADVHIGAALHLGDRGLVDVERLGQMLPGQFSGFSKLGGARFSSGAEARNILVFTARLKSCPSQTACHPEQGIEAQRQTRKSSCRRGKPSAQILRVAQDDSAGGDDRGVASPLSHVSKGARDVGHPARCCWVISLACLLASLGIEPGIFWPSARIESCPPQTPCHPEQSVRCPVEFEVGLKLLYGSAS